MKKLILCLLWLAPYVAISGPLSQYPVVYPDAGDTLIVSHYPGGFMGLPQTCNVSITNFGLAYNITVDTNILNLTWAGNTEIGGSTNLITDSYYRIATNGGIFLGTNNGLQIINNGSNYYISEIDSAGYGFALVTTDLANWYYASNAYTFDPMANPPFRFGTISLIWTNADMSLMATSSYHPAFGGFNCISAITDKSQTNLSGNFNLGSLGGNPGNLLLADSMNNQWDILAGGNNGVSISPNLAVQSTLNCATLQASSISSLLASINNLTVTNQLTAGNVKSTAGYYLPLYNNRPTNILNGYAVEWISNSTPLHLWKTWNYGGVTNTFLEQ